MKNMIKLQKLLNDVLFSKQGISFEKGLIEENLAKIHPDKLFNRLQKFCRYRKFLFAIRSHIGKFPSEFILRCPVVEHDNFYYEFYISHLEMKVIRGSPEWEYEFLIGFDIDKRTEYGRSVIVRVYIPLKIKTLVDNDKITDTCLKPICRNFHYIRKRVPSYDSDYEVPIWSRKLVLNLLNSMINNKELIQVGEKK